MNSTPLQYGSVASGIEAASLAWQPLGWQAVWFAEIDPFTNAVLAHRYPDVPNLGDMRQIAGRIRSGAVPAPDILVGGTPCQAFSVAGLRGGLNDPRGALTLTFTEIANAIDDARKEQHLVPSIIVWENVTGVFSDRSNAFGTLLGALAGEARAATAGAKMDKRRLCVWNPPPDNSKPLRECLVDGLHHPRSTQAGGEISGSSNTRPCWRACSGSPLRALSTLTKARG